MVGRPAHVDEPARGDRERRRRHDVLHAVVVDPRAVGRDARLPVRDTAEPQVEITTEHDGRGPRVRSRDRPPEQVAALGPRHHRAGAGQMGRAGGEGRTRIHAQPGPLLRLVDVLRREDPAQCRARRAGTAVGVRAQPRHDADPVRPPVAAADRAAGTAVRRRPERRQGRAAPPAVGERPLQDGHVALAHLVEGDHVGRLRTDHRSRPVDGTAREAAGETAVAEVQLQHARRVTPGRRGARARHEDPRDQTADDRRTQPRPGPPPLRHCAPCPPRTARLDPRGRMFRACWVLRRGTAGGLGRRETGWMSAG